MFRLASLVGAVAVMAFVGAGATAQEATRVAAITLELTSCYGSCPVYKVTISGDGRVVYEGRSFVRVEGEREVKIDPAYVKNLVQQFLDIHYFELKDQYRTVKSRDGSEVMVTDLPLTYTSLSVDGKSKKVEDYFGGPDKLAQLGKRIDEVAGTKRWVTIDAEQAREEFGRGLDVRSPDATELLVRVSEAGDADAVKAFIEAGANVNAHNELEMPIQVAGSPEVVRLLIAAGADVNGQVAGQNTDPALQHAARWGDAATVREMLRLGARIDGKAWGRIDGIDASGGTRRRGDRRHFAQCRRQCADSQRTG